MTETIDADVRTETGIKLPPVVPLPKLIQGIGFISSRRRLVHAFTKRYGHTFVLHIPVFGRTVIVSDPALVKRIFTTSNEELINIQPNLSRVLGPGSMFALDRGEHRARRKLLTPPFHGKSIKNYERIIEEETLAEAARWPEGEEFPTIGPMSRITLNIILRTVFGAEGQELDELRLLVPGWVTLGSKLAVLPTPTGRLRTMGPWRRLSQSHRKFDGIIDRLIDNAKADPNFEQRTDILSMMLQSRYDDGSEMTRRDISDEMLTLVAAGHETTASTLAWAFERLRRHPGITRELVAEADAGDGNELRQATILEIQRARTVIDFAGRHVAIPFYELGDYVIPQGYSIIVPISELHENTDAFPDPGRFDPYRFVGNRPPTFTWLAFGGGSRRCIGATFANFEMDVVLRTVLRQFTIEPSTAPDAKWFNRGVAYVPKDGGRVVLRRRPEVG